METQATVDARQFSRLAEHLILQIEKAEEKSHHKKIVVNPLVSKFASLYEKLRNAMDYREGEVIMRAAIERILKRRIILGGNGKKVAEPLIRELVWARYFPDDSLSEAIVGTVEKKIDLYLQLRNSLIEQKILGESQASEWMYQLLSSDIEYILHPMKEKELVNSFMYQIMRENISITDDTEQNRDIQVLIAVRKAFAKHDLAFLRYHLFTQFFGEVSDSSFASIVKNFQAGYKEIQAQLDYARKDRIYTYVKSKTGVFFILEDLLHINKGNIKTLYADKETFKTTVFAVCQARYGKIRDRVQRAIIRSIVFILLTKVFFAFAVEGTFESLFYGRIYWNAILANTIIPPLLMVGAALFLKTPKDDNSALILSYIQTVLSEENARLGSPLGIKKHPDKKPFLYAIFTTLWFLTFLVAFGGVIFFLTKLHFQIVSQMVFLFFLAIVSFLAYRIGIMAREYTVEAKQGLSTPLYDFFVMPVVRVGRHLTEGISQINIFLFVFDFIIETPFKGIFSFVEQWFFFLHAKREEL